MSELDYEQKLTKVLLEIRDIRPFYAAIYESMEKIETNSIETMGVTTNKLYYNKSFVEARDLDELLFVNLHEIGHIALMHVARKENRDLDLWNIACDMYVNKCLADEFNLTPGNIQVLNGYISIKLPEDALCCSSIDINNDYVENIYEDLYKQAKENGYTSHKPGTYHFSYSGSGAGKSYSYSPFVKSSEQSYPSKMEIDISIGVYGDILESGNGKNFSKDLINNGDDQNSKEQQSRKILSDALVRSEMQSNGVGTNPGLMERFVKNLLKAKLNWKKLFKKYLIQITSADSSFLRPDKRMYYQRAIYPGQMSEESNHINGVKICIDTSGSISEEDMSRFYYQVCDILKNFEVDAELIFWDAEIYNAGNIKTITEFNRVDCYGGGGTQPRVVFDNFINKKEKPRVILMLTDGFYFDSWDKPEYKRKFKDTIWIMTKNYNKNFNPPFGKLAVAEFID